MFGKIILGILAIIFWPITLGVGGLILFFALWKTFINTKDHYRAPRNEETGEVLKSFLMGGEWDDDYPPDENHCINAWMFLLADAEELTDEEAESKAQIVNRASSILNHLVPDDEADFDAVKDSVVPDLLFHMRQAEGAQWIETELVSNAESLHFPVDKCLKASKKSKGIHGLSGGWEQQADEELNKVRATIPEYSDEEISSLAKQFATSMRANEQNLEIVIDTYEKTSFYKALSRFEWGGETVTEQGLAHMSTRLNYSADSIPTGSDLERRVWDEVWETKRADYDYEYGFVVSETTSNHGGKKVPVIVDIDDAPEYYIWTVSEGAMDYDIYEEKHEGDCTTEITKAVMSVGDLTAVFEIAYESSYAQFLEQLIESIDQLNNLTPEFLQGDD